MKKSLKPWKRVQDALPPLSRSERIALELSLQSEIINQPILHLPDGRIVDGHHRWELSKQTFPYLQEVDLPEDSAFALALTLNYARRQMSQEQITLLQETARANKELQKTMAHALRSQGKTQEETAVILGVAQKTIDVWESQDRTNSKITNSSISPPPDYRVVIPSDHQAIIYERYEAGETQEAIAADYKVSQRGIGKIVKKVKMARHRQKLRESLEEVGLPEKKKYRVIYADPPWQYGNTMPEYFTEQADHYPLMTVKQICEFGVVNITEENAVLFLWVTSPILAEAFDVIRAWGFEYKASFVWDKIRHNMGHYNSVRHEFLLVCTRGSCQPDVKKLFDSVVSVERTEHSEKPEIFREMIDTIYPEGNRIELFARKEIGGWDYHGNENIS